jgi:Mg2+ and Co2+ transporter CorA
MTHFINYILIILDKVPKITELHYELASLREKLVSSDKVNEYLRKQIEVYHITHGNADLLMEMAQKLNLTKDELEQYKEKLNKIQDISNSLPTNKRNIIQSNSTKGIFLNFNLLLDRNTLISL